MAKLEIVATTIEDIKLINESKADRIILLSNLEKGGATPSLELVKNAREITDIPIRVMVREITDTYIYSEEVMKKHIDIIKELVELDVEGIAFGSLTEKGEINFLDLEQVINNKRNLKLTFNKAFDEIDLSTSIKNFKKLSNYDVDILMTGNNESIDDLVNLNLLKVMPAAGIKLENVKDIVEKYNSNFLHIGSAARENGKISPKKINELAKKAN